MLEGLVDVYLPDFKYFDEDMALNYSKAKNYPEVAKAAIAEMYRQVGEPIFDSRGIMKKGVIVRHLLLPGGVKNAKNVVSYLHETYGDSVYISLMNQYTPLDTKSLKEAGEKYPALLRKVTKREYEKLLDYVLSLNIKNAYFQEDGTTVGYALVRHTVSPLYLRQFYIDRAYRRRHLGEQAFRALLETLQTDTIDIDVLPWNTAGAAFWKSMGFSETCISMRYGK